MCDRLLCSDPFVGPGTVVGGWKSHVSAFKIPIPRNKHRRRIAVMKILAPPKKITAVPVFRIPFIVIAFVTRSLISAFRADDTYIEYKGN